MMDPCEEMTDWGRKRFSWTQNFGLGRNAAEEALVVAGARVGEARPLNEIWIWQLASD